MRVDIVNGFLGCGKTTLVKDILRKLPRGEKTAVLVNEFGEIGIDGELLGGAGAEVVELANGCICCTLNADLKSQISFIAREYKPQRLIIEPTGLATIGNLFKILQSPGLAEWIGEINVIAVLDGACFKKDFAANPLFFKSQLTAARLIVINKCDKIDPEEALRLKLMVAAINRNARVLLTSFAKGVAEELVGKVFQPPGGDSAFPPVAGGSAGPLSSGGAAGGWRDLGQYSRLFQDRFDPGKLTGLFNSFAGEDFGQIVRAKGIFETEKGQWLVFNYTGGETLIAGGDRAYSASRVVVIGRNLNGEEIDRGLAGCMIQQGDRINHG